jgi:hypothetical protein
MDETVDKWLDNESFDMVNPDPPCFKAGCDKQKSQHPTDDHDFVDFGDPEDRFHKPA